MDNDERKSLLKLIEQIEDGQLCDVIVQVHELHKTETDPFLSNWQKVHLAYAISSYNIGWYNLCKAVLSKALERNENISQEPFTRNSTNTQATEIDENDLEEGIKSICGK
ncbi:hypothetical protein [Legionella sp. 16cNR16C]|uniref:hypothetical protein n=1 Tax=Legionella sp. 16cNR16C TaxID=2905656 RepID=UPI001E5C2A0E|nr:hypothetical protein [Legionella sp. 16cNR16C]MCE3045355.1 hypothetical protein [Legionella sp. 16cNR16C]